MDRVYLVVVGRSQFGPLDLGDNCQCSCGRASLDGQEFVDCCLCDPEFVDLCFCICFCTLRLFDLYFRASIGFQKVLKRPACRSFLRSILVGTGKTLEPWEAFCLGKAPGKLDIMSFRSVKDIQSSHNNNPRAVTLLSIFSILQHSRCRRTGSG